MNATGGGRLAEYLAGGEGRKDGAEGRRPIFSGSIFADTFYLTQ